MPREVRIALIMGGGVSLGSFSGGALGEVLRLLEHFPAPRPQDGGPPQPLRPKIDVVTGASAGSMTLGIMLRHLLAGRDAAHVARLMREAWVEGVGIDYLGVGDADRQLLPDLDHHDEPSLLSTRPIQRLADALLREGTGTQPAPSPLLADTVYASFAAANLHGVDVRAPTQLIRQRSAGASQAPPGTGAADDALVTTFHDDRVRFRIEAGAPAAGDIEIEAGSGALLLRGLGDPGDPADAWSVFRAAAIASGSFPAAFPPVPLVRRRAEFGRLWPEKLAEDEAFRFHYVDGGTFRNEPLREAIELAALQDAGGAPDAFERVFVLIDPNVSGSGAALSLDFEHPLSLATSWNEQGELDEHELARRDYAGLLVSVLARVAAMVQGQSTFRDWLRAAKVNSRVGWEPELVQLVSRLAAAHAGDPAFLTPARALLARIYRDKVARGPNSEPEASQAEAERRRDADLAALRAELGSDPGELALALVLALRNVSGLRRKRHLDMVAISPWSVPDPPLPLAGNFLANFGGFFEERWRELDHRAGRFAAHHVLTLPIGDDVDRLIAPGVAPAPARPSLTELSAPGDPGFDDVDAPVREAFLDVVRQHVENLAHALGVPNAVDDLLSRLVRPRIERALRAPTVTSRHVVVRIRGGVEDEHELKRSASGDTRQPTRLPDGSRVLETIVELQKRRDAPAAARHRIVGPHVLAIDGRPEIWVMRDTLLTSPKRKLRVRLNGDARAWFEAAERRRLLEIPWNGQTGTRSKRPRDLDDFGPAPG